MPGGLVRKMKVELDDEVQYHFRLGDELIPMNGLVGKSFGIRHMGVYSCVRCGRSVKKPYNEINNTVTVPKILTASILS